MNSLVKENHKKISDGLTIKQFRERLKDQGFSVSKQHIIGIIKKRKLRVEGLVLVQKIYTSHGLKDAYIIKPEGGRIITLEIKKIFPEQKKEYLIESTKPKSMSLTEIKQFGLALIGLSETMENHQKQIEDLQNQQDMCRVSGEKDNELLRFQRKIIKSRLHKKKLSWDDDSARGREYAYLRGYLDKSINLSRVTNLNAKEYQIVRDELLGIMDLEKIPY